MLRLGRSVNKCGANTCKPGSRVPDAVVAAQVEILWGQPPVEGDKLCTHFAGVGAVHTPARSGQEQECGQMWGQHLQARVPMLSPLLRSRSYGDSRQSKETRRALIFAGVGAVHTPAQNPNPQAPI